MESRSRCGKFNDLMTLNGQVVYNYSPAVQPDDAKAGTVHGGGMEWTIKGGVPYHVPTLMREVKDMVATARVAKR